MSTLNPAFSMSDFATGRELVSTRRSVEEQHDRRAVAAGSVSVAAS
jgi:hypothetical protein